MSNKFYNSKTGKFYDFLPELGECEIDSEELSWAQKARLVRKAAEAAKRKEDRNLYCEITGVPHRCYLKKR